VGNAHSGSALGWLVIKHYLMAIPCMECNICPPSWLFGTVICCNIFARTEILTHCVLRILPEAAELATDLFLIKLSTCKVLIYLVTFL
jgi:hypothetical protein